MSDTLPDCLTLPDCMLPDGADPCVAYQKLARDYERLSCENAELRAWKEGKKGVEDYLALKHENAELRKKLVSGFYEDDVPTFTQGPPTHELESLVTAEEVQGYANTIAELREKLDDLNEVVADARRLTRELDVAMHGESGAARQASLCDLIEPARQMRRKLEWREIETAPKDGRLLLLYSPDDGAHEGRWVDDRYDIGWCVNGLFSNCWSHWMPLLAPPK